MITKIMYALHRILGSLFSILFLVWFLSAFVMMYHSFPRTSVAKKLQKQELLSVDLPPLDTILSRLPKDEKVISLTLNRYLGQTIFHIRTDKEKYEFPADASENIPVLDGTRINQIAALWSSAPIHHIDTLNKLDQWIPFEELKKEFPIYKYYFNDSNKHQLYISSQSGEVLQFTDRNSRFWAWVGAIPHWVYFTWLRQNTDLWNAVVAWLAAIGCLMIIAGLWVGIHAWRQSYKKKKEISYYRKKWYRWHHISGIFFGLFTLIFCFSGMISVTEVPGFISKPTLKVNPLREIKKDAPKIENYILDYREVLASYLNPVQLEWSNFRSHPYYTLKSRESEDYIDASDTVLRPLNLTEDQVSEAIRSIHGDSIQIQVQQIIKFETYYRDMSRMYHNRSLLPVWKITVADTDHSCYYIHPETGIVRYVNTTARWKYWMYTALHRMRIQGLNSLPTLRKTVLWVLLLGGTVVSLSGVALGVKYIIRKAQKAIRKR
ncbi:MAG: PepSY domain-containing protein [Massilibacteroides sp.]|nr:PepSY domain-containing protein [Massilibacteroides sp.]MDD3062510.1 PepSY domain-containing protein [Massilibacteroides sp.]MDD4114445.1 PepSY domain-containing protein [Massilibacteroides sp.]MDD4660344.1 PepSY domain-containing protein [Massilibacteroides sp.]